MTNWKRSAYAAGWRHCHRCDGFSLGGVKGGLHLDPRICERNERLATETAAKRSEPYVETKERDGS